MKIPDNVKYAYKYLSDNGMDGLVNLHIDNNQGIDIRTQTPSQLQKFADYASFVVSELKPYTKYYTVLNEYDLQRTGEPKGRSGDNYDMDTFEQYATIQEKKQLHTDNTLKIDCRS